jgi:hypothetical protein
MDKEEDAPTFNIIVSKRVYNLRDVTVFESKKKWVGHVARVRDIISAHEILVRKPQRKETIWRQRVDKILKCLIDRQTDRQTDRHTVWSHELDCGRNVKASSSGDAIPGVTLHWQSASWRYFEQDLHWWGFMWGKRNSEFAVRALQNYNNIKLRVQCSKKSPSSL